MFRIRKVNDDLFPMNKNAVEQVMEILRHHFSDMKEEKILSLPEQLRNPLKYRFRSILFVADKFNGTIRGFALLLHAPDLDFCFLDYIATGKNQVSSGIGGALYSRCREEALLLNCCGIFMECLPDDPLLCDNPQLLKQNASRLKFYEGFGARPIANTLYETPVKEGETCPPYLVFDCLNGNPMPTAKNTRRIVNAILRRKYGDYCPIDYINRVVDSFQDDPVLLRPFRYVKTIATKKNNHTDDISGATVSGNTPSTQPPALKTVFLAVNDEHAIHHVREVGYVEAPVRIPGILKAFENSNLFQNLVVKSFPEKFIRQVHQKDMVDFLKSAGTNFPAGNSIYPYIFPIRNAHKKPTDTSVLAGYYCIDTFTPIHKNVWKAASRAVDCALSCANALIEHGGLAYALVRPPGHHAESRVFGGFCYLNTAAVAANYFSMLGKVAILDIDYHHGNGQQEIFYQRKDVLTLSLHGHPATTYPYFCGFRDEKGAGEGLGYNYNYPLKEGTDAGTYRTVLLEALQRIETFKPAFLVVCLGLDTAKGDPTGTFTFTARDFEVNAGMISRLKIPTLVVQEGGYLSRTLGINALNFFKGLRKGFYS